MKTSEQIDKIAEALSKAQGAFKNPEKNRSVTVTMKSGGSYSYNYAELSVLQESTRAPLSENGLSVIYGIRYENNVSFLECRLMHSSGQWIESDYFLPRAGDTKAQAGEITYGRRYLYGLLTGIVADEDQDGTPEDGQANSDRKPAIKPQGPVISPIKPVSSPVPPSEVTQPMLARLFAIIGQAGISNEEAKEIMFEQYGISSSKELNYQQYTEICDYFSSLTLSGGIGGTNSAGFDNFNGQALK